MKRINVLDEYTSNKIAAGEVVTGPSSVVKELIENSIDAGAKNITIEIEEGGTSLIRIIDDGHGIHPDDIKLAFLPHATSKIKSSEDIYSINTLGFRGEALPSIAAVSKMTVKSKIQDIETGYMLNIEAGDMKEFCECGMNNGTVMEVRDLFFNVPAWKKFFKSTSRDGSMIIDIVNRLALANDKISFKLFSNGKKVLHTFGNGNLSEVIRTVYGKTIADNIIYFENASDSVTVYGYIGKESIARGSRNNQSIFVNGRYIKHKTFVVAVENAFKSFTTVGKFPFFVLYIEINPEFLDVNIHPTKAEVKFDDDKILFSNIFNSVHVALKKEIFNSFDIEEKITPSLSYKSEPLKIEYINPKEEPLIKQEEGKTKVSFPIDFSNTKEPETSMPMNKPKEEATIITKEERIAKLPELRIIGQFNKTYILAENEDILYMIDQHAAHEKILFEKYMKQIKEENIIVQPMLVPSMIDLTPDDYIFYEENKDVFIKAGFLLEEFGGNSLAIMEVPYFVGKLNPDKLLLSIIDNLMELGSGKTTEVKYDALATMAWKAAVKGNDSLSQNEMEKLINDLRYIDDPFHCPHGRPTIIKFTNFELEKKFKRIV